jgi:hypothetical protein
MIKLLVHIFSTAIWRVELPKLLPKSKDSSKCLKIDNRRWYRIEVYMKENKKKMMQLVWSLCWHSIVPFSTVTVHFISSSLLMHDQERGHIFPRKCKPPTSHILFSLHVCAIGGMLWDMVWDQTYKQRYLIRFPYFHNIYNKKGTVFTHMQTW